MNNEEEATMPTTTTLLKDTRVAGPSKATPTSEQESPLVASLRAHLKKWYNNPLAVSETRMLAKAMGVEKEVMGNEVSRPSLKERVA